jgi:multidrug efflux pump subunit AcrA (membrane-fusion protein)
MFKDSHPDCLPSAQIDEFLPPVSRWTTLGGLCLVSTFGIFITLATVIKYNITVKAQATIRPSGEIRIVQSAAEGTVEQIHIEENQTVKAGDAIATIDDSQLQTKKNQLGGTIQQNQLQLMQLDAQIQALGGQIAAETDRQKSAVASATAELSRQQREYEDRQTSSAKEVAEAEAAIKLAEAELQKAQAELTSADANLESRQVALDAAITRRDRYQPVAEAGALPQDRLEEAQLAVEQQEQAVVEQQAIIEGQKQVIERQIQEIEIAKAKLEQVSVGLNPSDAAISMAQEKIAQESATGEASLARLNQERESLLQRQTEIQNQIDRDRQEIEQLETELTKNIIRAPEDGTIQQLNLRNGGQVVRSAESIAQIAPSQVPIVVKARVPAQDIGKVALSQTSLMRVSAYPYPDYGVLKGKVVGISPDAISPQGNDTATVKTVIPYFEVTIEPERLYLTKGDRKYPIQTGMEVTADIISREETVLTFILRKARLLADL